MWLVLLTMAPDADYVLKFFSDITYLQYHRGITHSLLMLPLWTWLIHSLLAGRRSLLPPWLIGGAILLHIMLDLITSFGTMILAPVSDWRASFDLVFIIDPLFTFSIAAPLLLALAWKHRRRLLAFTSAILGASYILLAAYQHHQAVVLAENSLKISEKVHLTRPRISALPMPFSPFHWQIVVDVPDGHYLRAVVNLEPGIPDLRGLFPKKFAARFVTPDPPNHIRWQRFEKMGGDIEGSGSAPALRFYRWFARYPVRIGSAKEEKQYADLRFAITAEAAHWPFRLRLDSEDPNHAWLIWKEGRQTKF